MSENTSPSVVSKTAALFTAENPVLLLNQIGDESDTPLMKVGDKVTAWNDLDYATPSANAFERVLSCRTDKVPSSKAVCDFVGGGTIFLTNINVSLIANTSNLVIPLLVSATVIRISSTGNFNLTGIVNPTFVRRQLYFFNVGSNNISIRDNDGASDAENRFLLGQNRLMQANEGLSLIYDTDSSRWRSHAIAL